MWIALGTQKELGDVRDIGKAKLTSYTQYPIPFANYATEMAKDLLLPGQASPRAMARWQPSTPVEDGEDSYIFRITATDASHAARSHWMTCATA